MKNNSNKIAERLDKKCPAFRNDHGSGGSTWHHCFCLAQAGTDDKHCTCVWHQTDTCLAGKWACLSFLKVEADIEQKRANGYLDQATAAAEEV